MERLIEIVPKDDPMYFTFRVVVIFGCPSVQTDSHCQTVLIIIVPKKRVKTGMTRIVVPFAFFWLFWCFFGGKGGDAE